jgi:hypothetical protein
MRGIRLHVTGSASALCDHALLESGHAFIRTLVDGVIAEGGGLLVGAGDEPIGGSGLPCIFDWTVLDRVAASPDPSPAWPALRHDRFVVVASQRGLEKIPASRTDVWNKCRTRSDFDLEVAPAGWRMAGVIRHSQVLRGDVLLAIGGGAGAEHLAELYLEEGKPVVPIHTDLGAFSNDGNGGSRFLHEHAMANVGTFFRLRDGTGSAAARLSALRLATTTDIGRLTKDTIELLADLRPRSAFYVRLLNVGDPEFPEVERFFRDVVDAVVVEREFTPHEMGRGKPEKAFINVEIFEALHRAGLVIVDLTGTRPNCTMELGYALARRRRIVLSAKHGTQLPFDEDKLPTYLWKDTGTRDQRIKEYLDWFDRYSDLPPVVDPLRI